MAGKRNAKGEGSLRKIKNGKWQWVLRTKSGAVTATGRTKKEAKANGLKKLASPNRPSTTLTLAEAWKALEPELCKTLAPTNYAAYRLTLSKVEASPLGSMPASGISASDLSSFASDACTGSSVTRRGHLARVRAVLNRLGHRVTVKIPKEPRKQKTTVYGRDMAEFLEFVRSQPQNRRLALGLLYMAGLRRSEACGLRFADIVGTGAHLAVSVTETDDSVHVRPVLKTDASMSYVPLGKELVSWIGTGKGFVLTGTGEPMKPRTLTQLVRRTVAGTKWADLRPQSLRRGHGQAVLETTGSMKYVSAALRNSLAVAEAEYTSVDPTLKDATHKKVFRTVRAKTSANGGQK